MLQRLLSLFMLLLALGENTVNSYVDEMNLGGYLFLVNRDFAISSTYEPRDLVMPDVKKTSNSVKMRKDAAEALEKLFAAAKTEENYTLVAVSGYRSYRTQSNIFARKVNNVGTRAAMLLVAPPGTSEHQLGLAMDIGCQGEMGLESSFGRTPEGKWVAENCHRFGFIIRYKEEWTDITGYAYESWHLRYVGVEHATRIHELDIPLEYYIEEVRNVQFALLEEGA